MSHKKGFTFGERNQVVCELCGRPFKTRSGLVGHLRFYHKLSATGEPLEDTGNLGQAPPEQAPPGQEQPAQNIPPSASNQQLRANVERARLESELRRYGIPPGASPEDVAQKLGLGEMAPGVKETIQSRAFNINQSPPEQKKSLTETWLTPEGVPILISALRGVVGTGQGSGGINELLSNIDGLIALSSKFGGNTQTLPETVTIGSVTLPKGMPMIPSLLEAAVKSQAGDPLARTAAAWLDKLSPVFAEYVASKQSQRGVKPSGDGGGIGREAGPEPTILVCEKCGSQTVVPPDALPGQRIKCINPECDMTWTAYDDGGAKGKPIKRPKGKKARVVEPEPDTILCQCGQLIDVSGKRPGDRVKCGACGEVNTVVSEVEAIPAITPTEREEAE